MKSKHPSLLKTPSAGRKTNGRSKAPATAATHDARHWKKRCSQLEKDCDDLRRRVADLQALRDESTQLICDHLFGKEGGPDFDVDIDTLLRLLDRGQSLKELISELSEETVQKPILVRKPRKKNGPPRKKL